MRDAYKAPFHRHPAEKGSRNTFALVAGRYKPQSELGVGGACRVDLAVDETTGRSIALKRLHEHLIRDPVALLLLEAEARALSILRGAGVPDLVGYSLNDIDPYIAMKHISGEGMAKRRLARSDAINIIMKVCATLSTVHNAGIVHRDVKAANILLLHDLQPVLIDFNYSLVPGVPDAAKRLPRVVGTPSYIAPEQTFIGAKVDRRADIYSLGIVAYCTLSGHYPYSHPAAADAEELFRLHRVARAPLMSELNPAIPHQLSVAVARAMEKDPQRRYSRMSQFADALSGCADLSF